MRKVLYILGDLSDSDINWLADNGQLRHVDDGTTLIQEGQAIEYVYLLLDGGLKVCLGAQHQVIAELQAGEIVGELSFLTSHPPTASVIADGSARLLQIPRAALSAELERNTGFAARFYKALGTFLADRLRKTTLRMGYAIQDTVDEDHESEDELDLDLMESLNLAAKRFEYLIQHLSNAQ